MRLILLLLAGCATTPAELQSTGTRTTHNLIQPPGIAAGCMARNIENHREVFSANIRQVSTDRMEVVVRLSDTSLIALAQVEPSAKGSRATVTVRDAWFYGRDEFVPALVKGC